MLHQLVARIETDAIEQVFASFWQLGSARITSPKAGHHIWGRQHARYNHGIAIFSAHWELLCRRRMLQACSSSPACVMLLPWLQASVTIMKSRFM